MRALVTGGAGFIGSHLADALLDAGAEVVVVDHFSGRHDENLEDARERGVETIRGDVTDVAAMTTAFTQARPDIILHLAAHIDVRRSVQDPSTDAHVNIGGTAAVLEAARHSGARRVVLASTAGVYGDPERLPISEDALLAPLSPYGASKAAAETYMSLFSRLHGISTLALRMSNVYGPRQDPRGEAGVIAIFSAAVADDRPATIYGDGAQTRDYVYVADVVRAFVAAAGSDVQGVLNISSGIETSLFELAAALRIPTVTAPARVGEITRSCLDASRARAELGWSVSVPLTEGLKRTVTHMQSRAAGLPRR